MSLVDRIAYDLNDPKHIAWSASAIESWIREAIGLAVMVAPELFKKRKIIKVDTCSEFQDVQCCEFIYNVIGECTRDGRVIRRLRRSTKWVDTWNITLCEPRGWGGLKRYAIENNNALYVAPQVPSEEEVYLLIECTSADDVNEDNLPSGFDAIIVMWALYRARSMDAESTVVGDMGEANYNKMKELISGLVPQRTTTRSTTV